MKRLPGTAKFGQNGFSLIELMIAMVVLAVGLLGGIAVICAATASNGRSRLNTTAATLAESTMEKIEALPAGATGGVAVTSFSDCKGTSFVVDSNPGGSPLAGSGAHVDFTQPALAGYSMQYVACSTGQIIYDVRWRIDPGPTPSTQLVIVSAKPLVGPVGTGTGFARPITLRSLRGAL